MARTTSRVPRLMVSITLAVTLAAVTVAGSTQASTRHTTQPLLVFSKGDTIIKQVSLPAGDAGFDFTWTHPSCSAGYEDPSLIAVTTSEGNLLTLPVSMQINGQNITRESPSRPYLLRCITKKSKPPVASARRGEKIEGPDVLIEFPSLRICATWNGESLGCIGRGSGASDSSARELHLWIGGGSGVKSVTWLHGKKLKTGPSGVSGADHIDFYPAGSIVPYIADKPGTAAEKVSTAALGTVSSTGKTSNWTGQTFPQTDGFDVSWTENACGKNLELAPVVAEMATQSQGSTGGTVQKLAAPPLVTPCISKLVTGTTAALASAGDWCVHLWPPPIGIFPTYRASDCGGNAAATSDLANMTAFFTYPATGTTKGHKWTGGWFTKTELFPPGSPPTGETDIKNKNTNITDVYVF